MFVLPGRLKNKGVETVTSKLDPSLVLASIYRWNYASTRIDITESSEILQLAVLGLKKRHNVPAHSHNPISRATIGTNECWIVTVGKIKFDLFDTDSSHVYSAKLKRSDLVIFHAGGHSLQVLSRKAQIYEIKNGPYEGALIDKKQI
jgi:hypothetical protein